MHREPHLKEGGTINTSTNEAYGEVKRGEGEGYEMVDIPPNGPTADDVVGEDSILDETVHVDVIDYPSSVYIPPGASKPSNLYHCV